jgi:hypothetical protein
VFVLSFQFHPARLSKSHDTIVSMINLEWLEECGNLQAHALEGHARLHMYHLSPIVIFYLGVESLIYLHSAGYVVCKARRIKCNEAKPTCN